MIGRILWFAGILACALITVSLQMDRHAAINPRAAALTAEPFRSFAQAQIATAALNSGDPQRALAEAQRLVRQRPMPAETLRLLAQAQAKAGRNEQSLLAIQIAAQRGWRDITAQRAMLELALAAQDEAEAARRFTALMLKNSSQDAVLAETGRVLFEEPNGQAVKTISTIIDNADRWRPRFLQRAARVLPSETLCAITQASAKAEMSADCAKTQPGNAQSGSEG